MKLQSIFAATLLIASIAAAQSKESSHAKRATELGVTSMDVYVAADRMHVLLAEREAPDAPVRLSHRFSTDGGGMWSDPVAIETNQPSAEIAHRGMDVQLAVSGENVVVAWTTKSDTNRFGRGAIATAISSDGGRTWRAGPNPADDGALSGYAFLDLAADDSGAFHLVWLDGRNGANKSLLHARSTDGGVSWSKNHVIDADVCECCWNTIVAAPGGRVHVLYRDNSPRDMAIARSEDKGETWSAPVTVGRFGWDVNACPHVGGGLAVSADDPNQLSAVVWSAKGGSVGAHALHSRDGGRSWSKPALLGDESSWRPDIARDGNHVVAAWDASTEGGATAIFAAHSRDGGVTWGDAVRVSARDTTASHPRIVRIGGRFIACWTEQSPGEPKRFVTRTID